MDILAALDEMNSMKSRHATVSVDAMLEALQLTAADREKLLEKEDEALIESVFSSISITILKSKELVKRIRDEDLETNDFIVKPSNKDGETSSNHMKRRRISEELPSKETHALTKASLDNLGKPENSRDSGTSGGAKPFHHSMMINIMKKAVEPDGKKIAERLLATI